MHFVVSRFWKRLRALYSGVRGHNPDTLQALECEIPALKPDFLIATGDQTTFGDKPSLVTARAFLLSLGEKGGVPKERIYCIPGNHDILLHYYSPIRRVRRNYDKVFGEIKVADAHDVAGCKLAVFSFDSTLDRKGQNSPFWPIVGSRGRVSPSSFHSFNNGLRPIVAEGEYFKIALIHHHPLPIPFKGSNAVGLELTTMANGGTFIAHMQESGMNLILHGHEHHPYSCSYCYEPEGENIVVVAAGTACQESGAPNSFNYLEIVPRVSVTVRQYDYSEVGFRINRGATKTFRLAKI